MAANGCPVFSRNHIQESVHGSGPLQITTNYRIVPKLRGVFRVHCLNQLTIAQLGEEDLGADAAANQQQHGDGRILRRIPALMNSVLEKPHPNVMKIRGFLRANSDGNNVQFLKEDSTKLMNHVTHVIYENCPHNLKEYIANAEKIGILENLSQQTIFQWAFQLISAIDHLHNSVGVMHRRINPETVYIFEDNDGKTLTLKLGDILFARKPSSLDVTAERNVPIEYAAPATFNQGSQLVNYGLPADIWSYGMVLYFITHREDPYREIARRDLRNHILKGGRPTLNEDLDKTLNEIIANCWNLESPEPFTAAQIKEKLAPIINGQN